MNLCACGCGEEVSGTWSKGHNRRKHWHDYPIVHVPETGCIRWLGPKRDGYGRWRMQTVHRLAYEEVHGLVPEGLVLDHVRSRGCRYRDCINVEHLEPVTQGVNAQRAPHIQAQVAQTHCKYGHELTGENLLVRPNGSRFCRTCSRERAAARYAAKRR